ncbi:MAG: hypothetical protein LAO20_16655 [Acidobacteriia bacterium]|nr:hypothetical protein [Terriglobia bacterium]
MPETNITRDQLKRLQTLWGQYARRELIVSAREARLTWASEQVNRFIASFSELTLAEASSLINVLQSGMGIAETRPDARPRRFRSRIKDKDQAHDAGTEGRHGKRGKLTIATAEDIGMIDAQLSNMGWTRARLDALLASPSSPLGRRSNPQLRTLADVNRVLWALRRISGKR